MPTVSPKVDVTPFMMAAAAAASAVAEITPDSNLELDPNEELSIADLPGYMKTLGEYRRSFPTPAYPVPTDPAAVAPSSITNFDQARTTVAIPDYSQYAGMPMQDAIAAISANPTFVTVVNSTHQLVGYNTDPVPPTNSAAPITWTTTMGTGGQYLSSGNVYINQSTSINGTLYTNALPLTISTPASTANIVYNIQYAGASYTVTPGDTLVVNHDGTISFAQMGMPTNVSAEELVRMYQEEKKRNRFKTNLYVQTRKRTALLAPHSPAELKARATLRDIVTEAAWRRYVVNGFIMVPGLSGKWYQIFNDPCKKVGVYYKHKQIANICIHTDSKCPPTDHVLNMKMLVEFDEDAIWSGGNVYNLTTPQLAVA